MGHLEPIFITYKNCMKKKMEVASPFHLHTVIDDQISQKDHGYVTPAISENAINVLAE